MRTWHDVLGLSVIALRLWIAIALVTSMLAMKWTSLRASRLPPPDARSMLGSPVLSVPSWRKRKRAAGASSLLTALLYSAIATTTAWVAYLMLVPRLGLSVIAQGYLGAPILYGLLQTAGILAQLLWLPSGWHYPPHMRFPFVSRSIDEFWGRRWGTYVADWARQMIVARYRRQPMRGALAVFVISGVWHELMIDVPLLLFCGVNVLGGWLAYFAIQALGALVEHQVFRRPSAARVIFAWLVVAGPAPLAVNAATLSALGLLVR